MLAALSRLTYPKVTITPISKPLTNEKINKEGVRLPGKVAFKSNQQCNNFFEIFDLPDQEGIASGVRVTFSRDSDLTYARIHSFSKNGILIEDPSSKRNMTILNIDEKGSYQVALQIRSYKLWFCLTHLEDPSSPLVKAYAAKFSDGSRIVLCDSEKKGVFKKEQFTRNGVIFHTLIGSGMRFLSDNMLALINKNRLDIILVNQDRAKYQTIFSIPLAESDEESIHTVQCDIVDNLLLVYAVLATKKIEQIWDMEQWKQIKVSTRACITKYSINYPSSLPEHLIPGTQIYCSVEQGWKYDRQGLPSFESTEISFTDLFTHRTYSLLTPTKLPMQRITTNGLICFSQTWVGSCLRINFPEKGSIPEEKLYRINPLLPSTTLITFLEYLKLSRVLGTIVAEYYFAPELIEVSINLLAKAEEKEKPAIHPCVSSVGHESKEQNSFSHSSRQHALLPPLSVISQVESKAEVENKIVPEVKEIVNKKGVTYASKYRSELDGQAAVYSSFFAQTRALLTGKRKLFANTRACLASRGRLFADTRATLSGERPLFASTRASLGWLKR